MTKKDPQKRKSQLRRWAALSGIGVQMGATIFICAWAGKALDAHFQTQKNWFTIGLVLFGVFGSIFVVVKQLNYLNKKDER